MKDKKRRADVFLISTVVLFLSGCGELVGDKKSYQGKTGEEVYDEIMCSFEEYEDNFSMQIELQTNIKSAALGGTSKQAIEATFDYKRAGKDESLNSEINTTESGYYNLSVTEIERKYYIGGTYYEYSHNSMDEEARSVKKEIPQSDYDYDELTLAYLLIPPSALEEATFSVKSEEVVLSMDVDMSAISEGFEGIFELVGSFTDFSIGVDVEISDMTVQVHMTKDCQFKYVSMAYKMQMGIMGGLLGSSSGDVKITMAVNDLGRTRIEAPVSASAE